MNTITIHSNRRVHRPVRIYHYRTVKIMKVMKSVLKRMKAQRHLTVCHTSVKKLFKLRKWMDHINPSFQLGPEELRQMKS